MLTFPQLLLDRMLLWLFLSPLLLLLDWLLLDWRLLCCCDCCNVVLLLFDWLLLDWGLFCWKLAICCICGRGWCNPATISLKIATSNNLYFHFKDRLSSRGFQQPSTASSSASHPKQVVHLKPKEKFLVESIKPRGGRYPIWFNLMF